MTYRQLRDRLSNMEAGLMEQDVTIFLSHTDEYIPARACFVKTDCGGVLDDPHFIIEIDQ